MARPRWPYRRRVGGDLPLEVGEPTVPLEPLSPAPPPAVAPVPPPHDPYLGPPPPIEPALAAPGPPGALPPEPPDRRAVWPWLVLLLILVLGGLAIAYAIGHNRHKSTHHTTIVLTTTPSTTTAPAPAPAPARVKVPSLIGLGQAEATRRLSRAGLLATLVGQASPKAKGTVVGQRPSPGANLARGARVQLAISTGPPIPTLVEVPDLLGVAGAEAVSRLKTVGLVAKPRSAFSSKPKGTVVAQAPASGTRVKVGAIVLLTTSKGPRFVTVPNLVGQTESAARGSLRAAGLRASVFRVPSAEAPGSVVAQAPRPGEKLVKGSNVRLNVSKGAPAATSAPTTTAPAPTTTAPTTTAPPAPTTTSAPPTTAPPPPPPTPPPPPPPPPPPAAVPGVVGQSQTSARSRIRAAGLLAAVVYVGSNDPAGQVVAQFPAPGTTLKRGARVRINVSLGPKPKPQRAVPDVTGEDEATATTDLEDAGFTVDPVDQDTADPSEDGVVLDQDPAAGSRAPAASAVSIFVGRYNGG